MHNERLTFFRVLRMMMMINGTITWQCFSKADSPDSRKQPANLWQYHHWAAAMRNHSQCVTLCQEAEAGKLTTPLF